MSGNQNKLSAIASEQQQLRSGIVQLGKLQDSSEKEHLWAMKKASDEYSAELQAVLQRRSELEK